MAFRDRERVEAFTDHFDTLVREASETARGFATNLRDLRAEIN